MPHSTTDDQASTPGDATELHESGIHLESNPGHLNTTPVLPVFRLLPSPGQLHDFPFQLSDPEEYTSIFQELSRPGYSNSRGFVAEKISNRTFLLRVFPVDEEFAAELIAVFEGDVLPPSS